MKIGPLNTAERIVVIAEIGNNHEGDYDVACRMVVAAAEAGADVVKFQTIVPELLVSADQIARLERLRQFTFSQKQFAALAGLARKHGVEFMSTPFDVASARFLDGIQPAFKIASGDNLFFPLIDAVARLRKPIILSTGLSGLVDIAEAHDRIWARWAADDYGLALLHCVSAYPVPGEQANLGAIWALQKLFPAVTVGYSDHTLGIEAAVLAAAAGARIIEKHFTLDHHYSDFRDHQLSADPEQMALMVRRIREVETLLGDGTLNPREVEAGGIDAFRRSVAAARDLEVGTRLTIEDLTWVRPGGGIPPGQEQLLLGRIVQRPLRRGQQIDAYDVDPPARPESEA